MRWTFLSSIRGSCSPIGGEQKEEPQPEEPQNETAVPFERRAEASVAKFERLSVELDAADDSYRQHSTTGAREGMGHKDLFRQRWLNPSCLFRLADPRREARYPARGADFRTFGRRLSTLTRPKVECRR